MGTPISGERGKSRRPGGRASAPASGNASPRGFTLFEVIIALTLSLLLMTAVYAAIRLQYRISESGREQMERAQLTRAIVHLIENDIRSVVWQVQEPPQAGAEDASETAVDDETGSEAGDAPSGSAPGTSSTGGGASTTDAMPAMTTDSAFASGTSGIFGDSRTLVLHINRPSRDLLYASSADEEVDAFGRSDLASVSYFIADSGGGGLSGAVAAQNSDGSPVLGGVVGLARMEEDRLSMSFAGDAAAVDSSAASARVIAPEVVAIEFAYWDGLEWLEAWDSDSSGTLPCAIGITLSIDTESTSDDRTLSGRLEQAVTTGQSAPGGQPVEVRYVIAVPLAEPYVSEASI